MKDRLSGMSEGEQRWEALNPVCRDYLTYVRVLAKPPDSLTTQHRIEIMELRDKNRAVIEQTPVLQQELGEYLTFQTAQLRQQKGVKQFGK